MKTAGDRAAEQAIEERLATGPADVVELAAALRTALPGAFSGAEGALHPLLHRLVREGRAAPIGRAASGSAVYAKPGAGATVPTAPLDAPPAVSAADSRAALRVARGARDAEARGRIVADVLAHRAALPAGGRGGQFGSPKGAGALVRRVDRGRTAVCLPADGGERFQRFLFHEGLSLAATLGFLVLVWIFAAEPRVIPSNSMRPGLKPGDRVVVWKPGSSSAPPRWSVVVFRRPDDLVLIKRVVGLPGERVWVSNGEVYADGALLVKPDVVREAVREPLFDERFERFERIEEGETWTGDGGLRGLWRFRRPLFAHLPRYADEDGVMELRSPQHEQVHDLYVEAEFSPTPDLDIGIWIDWVDLEGRPVEGAAHCVGIRRARGSTSPAVAGISHAPGAPVEGLPGLATLDAPGGARRLSISLVDGVFRAAAGGVEARGALGVPASGRARLHVEGDLRRLRVDRDVHYTTPAVAVYGLGEARPVSLGPTEVFLLGDHSANSRDGRFYEVGPIDLSRIIGRAVFRVWPPLRVGPIR